MRLKNIIEHFIEDSLKLSQPCTIPSYKFEFDLAVYGKTKFNIMHMPGSYSREFRRIREKKLLSDKYEIEENEYNNKKYYTIRRIKR